MAPIRNGLVELRSAKRKRPELPKGVRGRAWTHAPALLAWRPTRPAERSTEEKARPCSVWSAPALQLKTLIEMDKYVDNVFESLKYMSILNSKLLRKRNGRYVFKIGLANTNKFVIIKM